MPSITTLNVVVQQANSAHDLKQARQQTPDQHLVTASQQQVEKEVLQRSTVQQSGEMEKKRLEGDDARGGKYESNRKKKKKELTASEKTSAESGRLLDTVA